MYAWLFLGGVGLLVLWVLTGHIAAAVIAVSAVGIGWVALRRANRPVQVERYTQAATARENAARSKAAAQADAARQRNAAAERKAAKTQAYLNRLSVAEDARPRWESR